MQNILTAPRHFEDENDLTQMLALLQAGRAAQISSYYVHTGDLKWWLYYPPLGASWWQNIYLWYSPTNKNHLMGWALLDPNGETFDVYFQPALYNSSLAEGMFAWAEGALTSIARSSGRKQIGMFWVAPGDIFRIRWLEERGYKVASQSAALLRNLAEPFPEAAVPDGFTVRPCRGLEEVEARARAQYGAFESSAPFEQYVARFTRFMQSPVYSTEADLVASAPGNRIASFCITWVDTLNQTGLFEPVGTHPDFHRMGLGKALMLTALQRLKEQGMQQAILCTGSDNEPALGLYASVGFRQYNFFRYYVKDLQES